MDFFSSKSALIATYPLASSFICLSSWGCCVRLTPSYLIWLFLIFFTTDCTDLRHVLPIVSMDPSLSFFNQLNLGGGLNLKMSCVLVFLTQATKQNNRVFLSIGNLRPISLFLIHSLISPFYFSWPLTGKVSGNILTCHTAYLG